MSTLEKKTFWQKPENFTTILSFLGIGVLGFAFLDRILPMVIRVLDFALETTVKTAALGGLLLVLTWLVTSKDLHKLAWLGYKSLMRKLTELVVTLDPIGILRGYIADLKKHLANIEKGLASLRGQVSDLKNVIRENTANLQRSQKMAAEAHKRAAAGQKNMKTEFMLQSRKAGRLEQSNVTYQGLLSRLEAHVALMEKVKEASEFLVEDMGHTVEEESRKRQMIHASFKAMSAAKAILAANSKREEWDMALEANNKDYYSKLGEIEQFMEDSQHIINTMDLENGVFEADALAKLEEWDKKDLKVFTGTKYRVEAPPHHDFAAEDAEIERKIERGSYADLFGKLD